MPRTPAAPPCCWSPAARPSSRQLSAELGIRAHAYPCDVGDPAAVAALAETVREDGRDVDVLVNNAGSGRWVSIEDAEPDELLDMAKVPYLAALLTTRAFVGGMLERRSGWIVTVNSGVSRAVWPGAVGYASARWALRGLDLALKSDLRGSGVGATEIVLGTVSSSYFANNPGSEDKLPKIARDGADRDARSRWPTRCARASNARAARSSCPGR